MLRVCEKLRAVDAKRKRLGLARTETDYLRALLDALENMDRYAEVEVLKSLGDVNLEKGQLDKNPERFDRAMVLYRTALLRCKDADVGDSLEYRYYYAEKLRLGKRSTASSSYEPLTNAKRMSSLAKVAEVFLHLEQRLTVDGNKESLLIEYTKLVIEGIVNDDNMLEAEAIKSLGDMYLKRGIKTGDTTCLTKATALYNTALVRCEGSQGRASLIHRLLYTARMRKERKADGDKRHVTSSFFRSYEEYLTTGDRALADGKLDEAEQNFASALRLIHDPNKPDRCKEADCLCRLGDVYIQRGKKSKEGRKLTQAAALFNAGMARTDENKQSVTKRLQEIEQLFLNYTANVETKPVPSDSAIRQKKRLQEMRTRAKSQLDTINQQHNPYKYGEEDPVMITVESERAEAAKTLFKNIAKDRQMFIKELVDECIITLGPPPCKYAYIGLGSQATELVTPYSDLEFAILIEDGKDNEDTRQYFINLTHYLHLKVINLGETILPAMAIPSLNHFPETDWFFDSVTPRGFAFDGFMPWASKTPFGRDQTKTKPPVSLIQTPAKMAEFQRQDVSVAEGYHLSDILRRVVLLTGEDALVTEYVEKLKRITTSDLLSRSLSRLSAVQILREIREQLPSIEPTGQLLNVKKDIYRFPGLAIEVLALCRQITLASTWSVIDELKKTDMINEENAIHLTVLTSISAELRLRAYLNNGGQQDIMSPLTQMKYQSKPQEVSETTLSSVFHIPDVQVLFRYYCRAIPLKKYIPGIVQSQAKNEMTTPILDTSHECRGRIATNLFLYNRAKHHLESALTDAGGNMIKRSDIIDELGTLWVFFDDSKTGVRLFEESLSVRKSIYGENTPHPDIAKSLHNLGWFWGELSDDKKAISYYEQSLAMQKTLYGDNTAHPGIVASLDNLGSSWSELGDQEKALSCYEQSLTMQKTIYGDNMADPEVVQTLNNLVAAWSELGYHKKALSYYKQLLTIQKAMYGSNTAHPDIAKSLYNLGASWSKLSDQKKAISYYEQALNMTKIIYGDNTAHPVIAKTLNNIGTSWSDLGDHKKALSYHVQALKLRETINGVNMAHPGTAASLNYIGSALGHLGDNRKAIDYHEQALRMETTIYGENTAHQDIAKSLHNLGHSWNELGDQRKAISYYEQSLRMQKTVYGDNTAHRDIAASLNNLGSSWSDLGDHKKAISYKEESLSMRKTVYGENTAHPDIATSLNNLGSSWGDLGDYKKAISYKEQSLSMRRIIYGDNTAHPDIAASLNSIATSWSDLGDDKKALNYQMQSLTMQKTIYGDNTAHPEIAASLNNIGTSWSNLGDDKKAINYYEQALKMQKAIYGENKAHPDIASSLQNVGSSWSELGDQEKSITYYEQALTMQKTIYGENTDHPDIAESLDNLGTSWRELGDHTKALSYYEQSLTMREAIYGDSNRHPDIASSLNNLGSYWSEIGDHKKAISYYEQSLTIKTSIYGDNNAHPDIAASLNNLGSSWTQLGDQMKAIGYYEQSLSMMKSIYGDMTHTDIATSLYNLGLSWSELGDHRKSIGHYEQSLTMRKTIYGDNTAHPSIVRSLNSLGSSWSDLGDLRKAICYYEQSLTMGKTIYGNNTAHPDILSSLKNLGSSWCDLGDYKKAISYCEQSLTMRKTIYGDNTAHPGFAKTLYHLQLACTKIGDHERATKYKQQLKDMLRAFDI
uniref:Protein-PII uridylyltransferase N-terminal domain-containing protein n=1 Tax=Branchiostoma floridae TaxID=7739 RepID=C3ZFU9_BRAFL|eukprot:XP_002592576.1 hypothetical protein BRAFLDRAFT_68898 [Branchiostoma floridae]